MNSTKLRCLCRWRPFCSRATRRRAGLLLAGGLLAVAGCRPQDSTTASAPAVVAESKQSQGGQTNMSEYSPKTDAEWQQILTPEQFKVLRKHGTERAFTGEFWKNKEAGVYVCAGCGLELFGSDHKFDSGTGWPSYWQPIKEQNVGTTEDRSFFMRRVEVHCARCQGHLGHIFEDGPAPTGLRYCINSASLKFQPRSQSEK